MKHLAPGWCLLLLCAIAGTACRRGLPAAESADPSTAQRPRANPPASGLPAGGTCGGRGDCARDHVCVDHVCRYRKTSVRGDALALVAQKHVAVHDYREALTAYNRSIESFRGASARPPPEILCGRAEASLRHASTTAQREEAAKHADACFRGSLPGSPPRRMVLELASRMQFLGLALDAFDERNPGGRFFRGRAAAPGFDAVKISISVPTRQVAGHENVVERIRKASTKKTMAQCFTQIWNTGQPKSAQTKIRLSFSTPGSSAQDTFFVGTLSVTTVSPEPTSYDRCILSAIESAAPERLLLERPAQWQDELLVHAAIP